MQHDKFMIHLEKPILFYPQLAKLFGSINRALYWQQLYYWSDKGGREDGFIYKTKEDIETETCLTREQQDSCRKYFEDRNYMETKLIKANGCPVLHYKLHFGLVCNALIQSCIIHETLTENTTENTNTIPDNQISTNQEDLCGKENVVLQENKVLSPPSSFGISADIKEEYINNMFNKFWTLYPRKVAKHNAYKAWFKIPEVDYGAIFKAISEQVTDGNQLCDTDTERVRFIPHPATWLNGLRWNDDLLVKEQVKEPISELDRRAVVSKKRLMMRGFSIKHKV